MVVVVVVVVAGDRGTGRQQEGRLLFAAVVRQAEVVVVVVVASRQWTKCVEILAPKTPNRQTERGCERERERGLSRTDVNRLQAVVKNSLSLVRPLRLYFSSQSSPPSNVE